MSFLSVTSHNSGSYKATVVYIGSLAKEPRNIVLVQELHARRTRILRDLALARGYRAYFGAKHTAGPHIGKVMLMILVPTCHHSQALSAHNRSALHTQGHMMTTIISLEHCGVMLHNVTSPLACNTVRQTSS